MSLLLRLKKLEQMIKDREEGKYNWRNNGDDFWSSCGISEEELQQCNSFTEAMSLHIKEIWNDLKQEEIEEENTEEGIEDESIIEA